MRDADEILATGGPGMVKAAYSSGKPALGVGPGNTPVIIDDSADIKMAVNSIIHSKTFDNGMICASEQSVTVLESIYDEVKRRISIQRMLLPEKEKNLIKSERTILINGALNAKIVGQKAATIAEMAGVAVPAETKILIGEVESVDISQKNSHTRNFLLYLPCTRQKILTKRLQKLNSLLLTVDMDIHLHFISM